MIDTPRTIDQDNTDTMRLEDAEPAERVRNILLHHAEQFFSEDDKTTIRRQNYDASFGFVITIDGTQVWVRCDELPSQ